MVAKGTNTNTTVKRKKKHINIVDKLRICERKTAGESVKKLAQEYEIGEQTVRDIVKKEKDLRKYTDNYQSEKGLSNIKVMKPGKYPQLDEALFEWFKNRRFQDVPISRDMLMAKGSWFAAKLDIFDLKCSDGWLSKWQRRFGIRIKGLQGELASADTEAAEKYLKEFKEETEGLTPDQIFNGDETGVQWLCMPDRSMVHEKELRTPGHKSNKQRVTALGTANASGNLFINVI